MTNILVIFGSTLALQSWQRKLFVAKDGKLLLGGSPDTRIIETGDVTFRLEKLVDDADCERMIGQRFDALIVDPSSYVFGEPGRKVQEFVIAHCLR